MLAWKAQGAAFAADVQLLDGRAAKVILVSGRSNPKGLALVVPSEDGSLQAMGTPADLEQLSASDFIEITAMQERAFGNSGLPQPELS